MSCLGCFLFLFGLLFVGHSVVPPVVQDALSIQSRIVVVTGYVSEWAMLVARFAFRCSMLSDVFTEFWVELAVACFK
jgi:hypothetical protein